MANHLDQGRLRRHMACPGTTALVSADRQPKDSLNPQITSDGRSATFTKAYSSVRVDPTTFVGFYLDLSHIEPDIAHRIELKLPGLKDGQFLGLFFDNVETEFTQAIAESGGDH